MGRYFAKCLLKQGIKCTKKVFQKKEKSGLKKGKKENAFNVGADLNSSKWLFAWDLWRYRCRKGWGIKLQLWRGQNRELQNDQFMEDILN